MQLISKFINTNTEDNKLLTIEEEVELTNKYYTTKDVDLRNKLVNHNLRLVFKIANSFPKSPDLISEGFIGLIIGVEKFDPRKGIKLSTYATFWIKAYMYSFILANARLVKIATTEGDRKVFWNLSKEKAALEALGKEVTPAALAERLMVSEEKVKEMEIKMTKESSLDAPVRANSSDSASVTEKHELIASDGMTPDEALTLAEREEIIKNNFVLFRGGLASSEKVVFDQRMMQEATLQEVGNKLNVSREAVRQIEARLVSKFKRFAETKNLANMI